MITSANRDEANQLFYELLGLEEDSHLDFKSAFNFDKDEFVKDVVSFYNGVGATFESLSHPGRRAGYMLLGVLDNAGQKTLTPLKQHVDPAVFEPLLRARTSPCVEVHYHIVDGDGIGNYALLEIVKGSVGPAVDPADHGGFPRNHSSYTTEDIPCCARVWYRKRTSKDTVKTLLELDEVSKQFDVQFDGMYKTGIAISPG